MIPFLLTTKFMITLSHLSDVDDSLLLKSPKKTFTSISLFLCLLFSYWLVVLCFNILILILSILCFYHRCLDFRLISEMINFTIHFLFSKICYDYDKFSYYFHLHQSLWFLIKASLSFTSNLSFLSDRQFLIL